MVGIKTDHIRLKEKLILTLKAQGFIINPHLKPKKDEKDALKRMHQNKRNEQLTLHKKFLVAKLPKIQDFSVDGRELKPNKIDLEIVEITSNKSFKSKLFFWWNLVWWSLPYTKPIGRQMRFVLWDNFHNAPFGLIGLQSPPLRSSVRDDFLALNSKNVDF